MIIQQRQEQIAAGRVTAILQQMPRQQYENTDNNSQDSKYPGELSNLTTGGAEKSNTAQAQVEGLQRVLTNMLVVLREDMNKYINEMCGNNNSQSNEIKKTVQDLKVVIKSIKKTQTKGKYKMEYL